MIVIDNSTFQSFTHQQIIDNGNKQNTTNNVLNIIEFIIFTNTISEDHYDEIQSTNHGPHLLEIKGKTRMKNFGKSVKNKYSSKCYSLHYACRYLIGPSELFVFHISVSFTIKVSTIFKIYYITMYYTEQNH